ncbi:hypothetical protein EDM57_14865 [Brevibacillus gelatini]|uniref:Uncharacterized protein n=1 Tax=Brevibacillus gelatini TaxID=1655277 RepID=A0A3M8AWU1_9BACL|nr:hypothetical protein EDM57_14865 [Brevibacillus gelatini]
MLRSFLFLRSGEGVWEDSSLANLTEWEMPQHEDALCVLSAKERGCYQLALLTFVEINLG